MLPFYEALGVQVEAVLTDNGREFCGRPEAHPYELLLAVEDIEHRRTQVRTPRTSGFVERMNRTLLDECFRVQGRTTWYERVDEIQADLDRFLLYIQPRAKVRPSRVLLPLLLAREDPLQISGAVQNAEDSQRAGIRVIDQKLAVDPPPAKVLDP